MYPNRLRLLVGAAALATGPALVFWLRAWPPDSHVNLGLVVVVCGMAVLAMQFPLLLAPRTKINTVSASYFAALLMFGPSVAMLVSASSQLIGGAILMGRRNPATGRAQGRAIDVVFNTSQWTLAVAAGGAVYYSLTPRAVPALLDRPEYLLALALAAAAMYLVNTVAVALIVALHVRQKLVEVWLSGRRLDVLMESGLYLIASVVAVSAPGHPWTLLSMAIPAGLIHLSLKRTLQLVQQTEQAVERMADSVDMRDPYTYQHSKRVAEHAEAVARRMGLSRDDVALVRLAARVHDLGKIAVPDSVLRKEGRLTEDEWEVMKAHVEAGCEILVKFPDYRRGLELVRCHHERLDGNGYPRRLRGDAIPIGAQIISVADAFDAMTTDRPYRRAMSVSVALDQLVRQRGQHWREDVVDAALGVLGGNDRAPAPAPAQPAPA